MWNRTHPTRPDERPGPTGSAIPSYLTVFMCMVLVGFSLTFVSCTEAVVCEWCDDDTTVAGDDDDTTEPADDDLSDDDDDSTYQAGASVNYQGSAQVDLEAGTYIGTESILIIDDNGMGDVLCQVEYVLTSVGERSDCSECVWAFDLVASEARMAIESGVGCSSFGWTTENVAALDGSTPSYGYAEEYIGHANVLMSFEEHWEVLSYAEFYEETAELRYSWCASYVSYVRQDGVSHSGRRALR